MSLDISFYIDQTTPPSIVDIPDNLYELLAKSGFDRSVDLISLDIEIEGELATEKVVKLTNSKRKKLRSFLRDEIFQASKLMKDLGEKPSKEEYGLAFPKLKILHELHEKIESKKFQYMSVS
jgi:hypothetical protein